ncbi:MAG: Ig-like domain-containing protein [Muribaculaceae bacterium]|jgi:sialate O-acetylesterase|nr:Ig-like domain-containing protein [Muribaculaceae bacterium]
MKRIVFSVVMLLGLLCGTTASAVKLPDIFSDNMVLQQQSNAKLWGWSKAGSTVTVKTSWNNAKYTAKAGSNGRWELTVATPKASFDEQTITFSDAEGKTTLKNVMIGEVWLCSGQSNMEMPLDGFWTQPIEGSNQAIAYSGQYKGLRMATIPKRGSAVPEDSVSGKWKTSCPENAARFGAVAYFFAETLTKLLNVPIGIINCSWGGSTVEGWLSKEWLQKYPDVDLKQVTPTNVSGMSEPMIMYNGQLHPIIGYTIKGIAWNQGESNVGLDKTYAQHLADMVKEWREEWGEGNLPFYMVEIPPYIYSGENNTEAALLRESQHKSAKMIGNCGVVSTIDLMKPYETNDIHGSRKQPIGERLGFMAAAKTYGMNGIACESPEFESMKIDGKTATLHFSNASDGFTPNRDLKGFEVAGSDSVFHAAHADEIFDTRDIKLTCNEVDKIVAVRYCFKNWEIGTVHSMRWLPLVPFRTDNWSK